MEQDGAANAGQAAAEAGPEQAAGRHSLEAEPLHCQQLQGKLGDFDEPEILRVFAQLAKVTAQGAKTNPQCNKTHFV